MVMLRSDFTGLIQPEISADIFTDAARLSVIQRLGRQVPLAEAGKTIPVISGKPTASWVAEGNRKPTTNASYEVLQMAPKKLAAIVPMSQELFRANPAGFEAALNGMLAEAFAVAFDAAALHGVNSPFDAALADTANIVALGTEASYYLDIVDALDKLAGKVNGFAFDTAAEPKLLMGVDGSDRPLIAPSAAEGVYGTLLGRPVTFADGVGSETVAGFAGDWSKVAWGVVGGIEYTVSTEATITDEYGAAISAFESNLVLVRAEAQYGLVIEDADKFCAIEYPVS